MIKSPFKAIVICVLLDKKISKTPVFPADMITQGGINSENSFITLPIRYNKFYSVLAVHKMGGYDTGATAEVGIYQELHRFYLKTDLTFKSWSFYFCVGV